MRTSDGCRENKRNEIVVFLFWRMVIIPKISSKNTLVVPNVNYTSVNEYGLKDTSPLKVTCVSIYKYLLVHKQNGVRLTANATSIYKEGGTSKTTKDTKNVVG